MSGNWITVVSIILFAGLYISISLLYMKFEIKRQDELLKIQAKKRSGQIDHLLILPLANNNFRLLIAPDVYASGDNYKIVATLGWNGKDLSEQVSRFPKIAVFKRRGLLVARRSVHSESVQEESQVRQKQVRFPLGDKNFDSAFSVYGDNEADVHRILTGEIRQGLLVLASKSPRLRTDDMRFFALSKSIKDTNTYDSFIDLAIAISQELTGTVYDQKQETGYEAIQSDTVAYENSNLSPVKNRKEITMSFFKNLFGKGEPKGEAFVPTPTQSIQGLEPIVVQAIENLFPNIEDQKKAFKYSLEYAGKYKRDTAISLLTMLAYSEGKIEKLPSPQLWSDGRFNGEELSPIFSWKMKNAEAWVKSITKSQV